MKVECKNPLRTCVLKRESLERSSLVLSFMMSIRVPDSWSRTGGVVSIKFHLYSISC